MIKEAAIKKDGVVYTGHRHCDVIRKMILEYKLTDTYGIQGFVTNEDKFVDRVEAAKIAFKCGQISNKKVQLYSEDLY